MFRAAAQVAQVMCAGIALTLLLVTLVKYQCKMKFTMKMKKLFAHACARLQLSKYDLEDSHDSALEDKLLISSVSGVLRISKCKVNEEDLSKIITHMNKIKFTDGKHKSKTFEEVFETDEHYVRWVQAHHSELCYAYQIFSIYTRFRRIK